MSSRPLAVLLAYYFTPDNSSGVQRAARFARYLPEYGFDCRVIASSHAGIDQTRSDVTYVPGPQPGAGLLATVKRIEWAQRYLVPYNDRLPWAPHAIAAAEPLLRSRENTILLSTSPPNVSQWAASILKRRTGRPWVADFRDPICGNPHRRVLHGRWYDAFLQRRILSEADLILTVTDSLLGEGRPGVESSRDKQRVLWNGFDPAARLAPLPVAGGGRRYLTHAGFLYRERHPLAVFDSLERLIAAGRLDPASFCVRFVGDVEQHAEMCARPSVRTLLAHGSFESENRNLPRAEANRQLAASDYLFLIDIVNASGAGYTVPAKIFDYALVGRPMLTITGAESPVDRIVARSGIPGVRIRHGDSPETLDMKLLEFFSLPATPVAPSEWFLETFDGRRQAAQLATWLSELIERRRAR